MNGTSYYTFTGNTYRNRETLKDLGAEWHPDFRCWMVCAGGNGLDRVLWQLRRGGVKIERHDSAPDCWLDRYAA
jgi:hypothetical protein